MEEMLDKDKLILVVEIGVEDLSIENMHHYLNEMAKSVRSSFDDSVITLFIPRIDRNYTDIKQLNTDKVTVEELNEIIEKAKKLIEDETIAEN